MAEKNPILEAAKRIPAQVAMGPADLLNLALGIVSGNGLGGVTRKSPSETINQDLLGLPEPELLSAQGGMELAAGFVNPAKALAAVGKATAMSAPALLALMQKASAGTAGKYISKQAGAIRPGGATDLNMFHATPADEIGRLSSFTDPSIAITSNRGNPFSGSYDANLVMNPSSPLFDPATSRSQLINRDAYVSTDKSAGRKSLELDDLRLTQNPELPLSHALSILFSPKFNSFSQFEKSVVGAETLRKASPKRSEDALAKALTDMGFDPTDMLQGKVPPGPAMTVANLLREAAASGNTKAKTAISKLALTPSDYAELKVVGEVPLNENTVSAVFLPRRYANDPGIREQLKYSTLKNVPAGTPAELLPSNQLDTYKNLAEYFTEQATRGGLDMPKSPYLSGFTMSSNPKKAYANILEDIFSSDKFKSDVASMLTSDAKQVASPTTPSPALDIWSILNGSTK